MRSKMKFALLVVFASIALAHCFPMSAAAVVTDTLYPGLSLRDYAKIPSGVLYSGDGYSLVETDFAFLKDALATDPETGLPMVRDIGLEAIGGGYFQLEIRWHTDYFHKMRGVPTLPDGSVDYDRLTTGFGFGSYRTYSIMDSNFNLLAPIDVNISCGANVDICIVTDYTGFDYNGGFNYKSGDYAPSAFIDRSGRIIKPFGEYDYAVSTIDNTGYYSVGTFANMYAASEEASKYVVMNKTGEIIDPAEIESIFRAAYPVSRFERDGKYGLIHRNGNVVLPAEYDAVFDKIVDVQGSSHAYDSWNEYKGFIILKDGKRGFCDLTGKVVIPPIYDEVAVQCYTEIDHEEPGSRSGTPAYGLEDGIADDVVSVRNGTGPEAKYALYNIDGALIVDGGQYTINGYSDGVVVVSDAHSAICLDTHGRELFRISYNNAIGEFIYAFSEGLMLDNESKDGKWSVVWRDKTGAVAIGPFPVPREGNAFSHMKFGDGLTLLPSPNQAGLGAIMDRHGKVLTPFSYQLISNVDRMRNGALRVLKWDAATQMDRPVLITKYNVSATASTVSVNGKRIAFDAYGINDNNYFKLRDLAYVLNGTDKRFEVGWDGANNAITLTSGKTYTVVGDEMSGNDIGDKATMPMASTIILDGRKVPFTAYNIGGNNYFKLRDIGAAFDFGV
ncbi:MAG: WG repeat-containing protein, partial [Clostridiales Family XIII bacterium]|nr:WG repeat-containing protein [Clostridiales Family XIII bacterium]